MNPGILNRVVMQQRDPPGMPVGSGNDSSSNETGAGNETNGTTTETGADAVNGTANGTTNGTGTGAGDAGGRGFSTTQGPRDSGGGGGGGLFDVGEQVGEIAVAIRDALQSMAEWAFDAAIELIVGTGAPDRIVGPPTNEPWLTLYNYAQGEVATIAMILFAFVIVALAAAGTFAGILSTYQTKQLFWRAGLALVFSFFWWPIGAAALQTMDWLATTIAPDGADFTSTIEGAIAGVAGTAIGAAVIHTISTGAILLLALLYAARWVALAGLLVFIPILVMLWVVDASVFSRVSNLASGFMSMFVPLLLMPLPTAMLMQVALLMFSAAASGNAGILGGPVLLFVALGTLVASVFAPKFTFDYARAFMSQSFGAEKIGKQLDAQLSALGAGIADRVGGSDSDSSTATLETPPALPPGDPTTTPSTGRGGSGAPAAPATAPVTATGAATASTSSPTTATGATPTTTTTTTTTPATDVPSSGDGSAGPTIGEAITSSTSSRSSTSPSESRDMNKYLHDPEYSVEQQRIESRRRALRRDSQFYGGDD